MKEMNEIPVREYNLHFSIPGGGAGTLKYFRIYAENFKGKTFLKVPTGKDNCRETNFFFQVKERVVGFPFFVYRGCLYMGRQEEHPLFLCSIQEKKCLSVYNATNIYGGFVHGKSDEKIKNFPYIELDTDNYKCGFSEW